MTPPIIFQMCEETVRLHNLYKAKPSKIERQSDRRRNLLKEQRQQRNVVLDDLRGIQEFVANLVHKRDNGKSPRKPTHRPYRNLVQLSEWLTEKPDDIENWYMVPCPKGTRCIVVAADGHTDVYSKFGVFQRKFHSALPGDKKNHGLITILDCVYTPDSNEYWVLDVLAYGNQDIVNCDASFRFFWLANKVLEDKLSIVSVQNEYAFRSISFVDCENDFALAECLSKYPIWSDDRPQLDGILFYHKESSYVHGRTPLVGWLFAFMVPEVLNLRNVHPKYIAERPADYLNYKQYIEDFDKAAAAKKRAGRNRRRDVDMDDSEISVERDDGMQLAERVLEVNGECIEELYYDRTIDD